MSYAPIGLFAYNRLAHLQRTVAALKEAQLAKESELYIFSDGPKNAQSLSQVLAIREWLPHIEGFKAVHIIEQSTNMGLAQSIITGVTKLVSEYGKVIVVEDDLEVSPHFLTFMNQGLAQYQHDEKVASIHGYAFPIKEEMPETYFLKGADCWGWATWKRAWQHFEADGTKLLKCLIQKKMSAEFDFQYTQPNIQMLKDQIAGKNNSWAIRWNASAYINEMLTLYPGRSLVRNIGLDNSGEHCAATSIYDVSLSETPVLIEPIAVTHHKAAFDKYVKFFKSLREPLHKKVIRKLKNYLVTS